MDGSKILIFTGTKRGADDVTRVLRQDGWPARAIHGDKSQSERDWVCALSFLFLCALFHSIR
jgi:ATP-dependent RNA helicase DDX5/DBP2